MWDFDERFYFSLELLTLQPCLQSQRQQARDDDVMEAPSRLLGVLNLLCYSLEAATRQHHFLHCETNTPWKTQKNKNKTNTLHWHSSEPGHKYVNIHGKSMNHYVKFLLDASQ